MDRHQGQMYFELEPEKPSIAVKCEKAATPAQLEPTDEMRRARAWLDVIQTPPVPDCELLAIHGWLSPEGLLYACAWEKHNELTRALGFKHESEIENAGYCKLSRLTWLLKPRYCEKRLTAAQWQTIEKWYERNGFPEEHFVRLSAPV